MVGSPAGPRRVSSNAIVWMVLPMPIFQFNRKRRSNRCTSSKSWQLVNDSEAYSPRIPCPSPCSPARLPHTLFLAEVPHYYYLTSSARIPPRNSDLTSWWTIQERPSSWKGKSVTSIASGCSTLSMPSGALMVSQTEEGDKIREMIQREISERASADGKLPA